MVAIFGQAVAFIVAVCIRGALGHGWVTKPLSRNELATKHRNLPLGRFRSEPQSSAGQNACGTSDAVYMEGPSKWQKFYDSAGVKMATLIPGSDFEVDAKLTADHGGTAWMQVACEPADGNIAENLEWILLERSAGDRAKNFLPSTPAVHAWKVGEARQAGNNGFLKASFHVPSDFSCPGKAIGRWLWKTGNSCVDSANNGRKTEPFSVEEYRAVAPLHTVCRGPPETFISCFDFEVGASTPAPPTPPTPPTLPPPTPAPTQRDCPGEPCGDASECRSEWGYCGKSTGHCNAKSTWKASGCGQATPTTPASKPTPKPKPPTTTTPGGTPSQCGSCRGCIFASHGRCISSVRGKTVDAVYCNLWEENVWCGGSGSASLASAPAMRTKDVVTHLTSSASVSSNGALDVKNHDFDNTDKDTTSKLMRSRKQSFEVTGHRQPLPLMRTVSQSRSSILEPTSALDLGRAAQTSAAVELLATDFVKYYNYSGNAAVSGTVGLMETAGTTQTFSYSFTDVDKACSSGPSSAANSCGVHIHKGTTCADDAGGHYYMGSVTSDPWGSAAYTSDSQGGASGTVSINTGGSSSDALGRAVIVHAHDGSRVACAILMEASPPTKVGKGKGGDSPAP